MGKESMIPLIREISNANGASGFEDEVLTVIRKYGKDLGEFSEDSLRNLYLRRAGNRGDRPVVQLDAHTDEVSFMVQAVKPNGTLVFIPLGGWVANNIPAHKVRVRNADGQYIPGVVASKPPHFMSEAERSAPADISAMAIDVGAVSREEAIRDFKIRIGEPVVPDVDFEYLEQKELMIGKAFDCRLGCAAVLGTMEALQGKELDVDVVAGFSVQEEVGARGASVTSSTIRPDIAVVFEGCPADDTFTEEYMTQAAIKKGPMLRYIDAGMITNPRYQRYVLDLGKKLGIPVQESVRKGSFTNGSHIHLSNAGVPVIVIGIPVRYIHTHYGIAALSDVENAVKLADVVIESLNAGTVRSF